MNFKYFSNLAEVTNNQGTKNQISNKKGKKWTCISKRFPITLSGEPKNAPTTKLENMNRYIVIKIIVIFLFLIIDDFLNRIHMNK